MASSELVDQVSGHEDLYGWVKANRIEMRENQVLMDIALMEESPIFCEKAALYSFVVEMVNGVAVA